MPLSLDQVREILQGEPRSKRKIGEAVTHENRVGLHTEMYVTPYQRSGAATDFLMWVRGMIREEKWQIFASLFRNPVETVSLSEQIFEALEKVFDGRDPVFKYEFKGDDSREDWEIYRSQVLKSDRFWREKGFERMKWKINSVMVVDLPREQSGRRPDPYVYFMDIGNIHAYKDNENGFLWLTYKRKAGEDREEFVVIDDEAWKVYEIEKNGKLGEELVNSPHGLSYCPANWFWSKSLNGSCRHIKKHPLSSELNSLDWALYYGISRKQLELYSGNVVTAIAEPDCDYEQETQTGERYYCDGGFLRDHRDNFLFEGQDQRLKKCPKCANNLVAGAGTLVAVPVPSRENNFTQIQDPVKFIAPPVENLRRNREELDNLWREIYVRCTGYGADLKNDQAFNEKQVAAAFEARRNVLRVLKENFEKAQKWAEDTICRLRYEGAYIGSYISYGTEFYMFSEELLLNWYTTAKENGAGLVILDLLQDQYYETKYRNDPDMLLRMNILKNVEPFRHLSADQVMELKSKQMASFEEAYIKANFSSLILKFERENGNITEFGVLLSFRERINEIIEELVSYVPNEISEREESGQRYLSYGVAVRAGAITPQQKDEAFFRQMLGVPEMGPDVLEAWKDDGGVRKPITIKSEVEKEAELEKLTE